MCLWKVDCVRLFLSKVAQCAFCAVCVWRSRNSETAICAVCVWRIRNTERRDFVVERSFALLPIFRARLF